MDIFDLHCDTITTALHNSADITEKHLAINFPKNPIIDKHCQCFAIFCPDTVRSDDAWNYYTMAKHFFDTELKKFHDYFEQAKTSDDICRIVSFGKTAALLTVEGAAVLNGDLENLKKLKSDGVKMITLTWNGENELGCGSLNQDFGLKPFGFDVIKEMERCKIIIDVSHLSDEGFYDVLKTVNCPVAASHSNLRSVCSSRRNLKEDQFTEIVRRKGIVGINFYKSFLNDDPEVATLSDIAKHIENMIRLGGEDVIALGSDYDGCDVVTGIEKMNDIGNLYDFLLDNGFGKELTDKIFWKNAYTFFEKNC